MQICLAAVGRLRRGPMRTLADEYLRRLPWSVVEREVEARGPSAPDMRRREGELLLAAMPPGARLVALDATGRDLTSEVFAERLRRWRDAGTSTLGFVIGGAEGLDPALLHRADLIVAFGRMTWPHLLARVMLAEQLYRAATILSGHPYHRG